MRLGEVSFESLLLQWQEHLGEDFDAVKYSTLRLQLGSPGVRDQVDRSLGLAGPLRSEVPQNGSGQGLVAGHLAVASLPVLRREALRRVLLAFSTWNRRLGYNHAFAQLCAAMITLPTSERYVFLLSMALYRRLGMDDYYVKRNGWLKQDAMDVARDVERLWPTLVGIFRAYGCTSRLYELIERLLLTMLAEGLCSPERSWSEFLPLLHRLIIGSKSSKDHLVDDRRWVLRHLVVCTLGRHCGLFEKASDEATLNEVCDHFQKNMRLDAVLLELVDAQIDVEECASFFGAVASFSGLSAGWLAGHYIGLAQSACTGVSLGVIGATVGAISTFCLGTVPGAHFACSVVNELLAQEEFSVSPLADNDSGQGGLQTPRSPIAAEQSGHEEGSGNEEAVVQEPSLDWYLWSTNTGIEEELRCVLAADARRRKKKPGGPQTGSVATTIPRRAWHRGRPPGSTNHAMHCRTV